jgi:hypothetical protein
MNIRRKEFIAEIKRLKRELADASARLSELEQFANPDCAIETMVPENTSVDEDENSIAAKVAFGMLKLRMRQ